ncbi:MAG TPA: hypothetical protein VK978_05150 [Candidatus Saccharimonadales bacterium]|nr:hypothetical protein [Candidatus Saccharimonadales bacterium]
MKKATLKATLLAVAKLTRIDPVVAAKSRRHNPILDSEIHIEEELINLKESIDSYNAASETLQQYPKVQAHITREKRAILKHCIGLALRMLHGRNLPRPYGREDVEHAVRRLVQLIVFETRARGQRLDDELMARFRPFLTVRQRVALRDFGVDMVTNAVQLQRAGALVGRLPGIRSK